MLERAVLLKARVQLLPLEHPACALLRVATTAEFETWATSVARIQSLPQLPFRIPDIAETMFADTVAQARADPESRRKAGGKYTNLWVAPALASESELVRPNATVNHTFL